MRKKKKCKFKIGQELMNETIKEKLEQVGLLGSASDEDEDDSFEEIPEIVVIYYTPLAPMCWIITNGEKMDNGDYVLFGYCHIHYWEWGCVYLSEIVDWHRNGFFISTAVPTSPLLFTEFYEEYIKPMRRK